MFNQFKAEKDCEWMEDELERYRLEEQDRIDREAEARRQREAERKEQWDYDRRHADSWPEALRKQASLYYEEAIQWPADEPDFPDDFFGPGAEACERALEIWPEIEKSKEAQIEELKAQIQAIRDSVRLEVADKLEAEGKDKPNGWRHVASAIREEDYNNWLWW